MRSSGILMHISSLPGPYGIGTLGKAAFQFVDFLHRARQGYWQILPVGQTGYGDSPYQTFSAFGGNQYLIDLEALMEEGLLEQSEAQQTHWSDEETRVDYGRLYANRGALLYKAFSRFDRDNADYKQFVEQERGWLEEYALFMAVKKKFGDGCWLSWPEDIRLHRREAVEYYRETLREQMEFHYFLQYEFFRQLKKLRDYAHENGISLIGDVPIYVPLDSADVWAGYRFFQLDEQRRPTAVAGVPPDYFSTDGQLWGNPLYRWDEMQKDGYGWWISRLSAASRIFDIVRIDHFRGFESYWSVPYGNTTAREGQWVKGPGMDLIRTFQRELQGLDFIAEDLGYLTDDVIKLVRDSGYPGMKVLEFAFDSREPSDYLPYRYEKNCICYTGTHDNETLLQWAEATSPADYDYAVRYLGKAQEESICSAVIRAGMSSVAKLFIAQMQDYLELGAEARMNHPGTLGGINWRWRATHAQLTDGLADRIAALSALYGRV